MEVTTWIEALWQEGPLQAVQRAYRPERERTSSRPRKGQCGCRPSAEKGKTAGDREESDTCTGSHIIAWMLCTSMKASDVTDTLERALQASGCDRVEVRHKPRLLSDNGASYISSELAEWLDDNGMDHVRGAPYHPQTQGKIERWHQTLKNRILLENYFLPGDLKAKIGRFVAYYNHQNTPMLLLSTVNWFKQYSAIRIMLWLLGKKANGAEAGKQNLQHLLHTYVAMTRPCPFHLPYPPVLVMKSTEVITP